MRSTVRHVMPVIVVAGLAFEARIANGPDTRVICQPNATLAAALEAAIAQGCRGLVSFGTAGGLVDTLRPGSWVIARAVLSNNSSDELEEWANVRTNLPSRYETDAKWSQALLQALEYAHHGDIAGVAAPVIHTADKRKLQQTWDASATDMESHIVACIAHEHGLPFVCARVIIDPVERTLPPAAIAALRDDGSTDVGAVLRSLVQQPRQLPALLRLARDARCARRALIQGRKKIALAFGLPAAAPG